LLHPTSLPGRYGIGDLGDQALRFVDYLVDAGQSLWQILPLGPTGYGDSPYQCFSALAGNPLLISPDRLVEEGLLTSADVRDAPNFPADRVDYGPVIKYKHKLLSRAMERFRSNTRHPHRATFEEFCAEESAWLDDFALFMAVKQIHDGVMWSRWAADIAQREPEAMARYRYKLKDEIEHHKFLQFLFFQQWLEVRRYANAHGIRIVGDVPIFVAYDSADVWVHRDLFFIDAEGELTVVAGVPPDLFTDTGQLWGNPLYRWDVLARQHYAWWIERFRAILTQVDIVRIDHFIGFTRYWEVPADEETAQNGRWMPGPGAALFHAVEAALGKLPIMAEDLGAITPQVIALREKFEFPGMRVLQFGFDSGPSNPFLPHNFTPNCVAYTGTHDNDTSAGWFTSAPRDQRSFAQRYLGRSGKDFAWDLIRMGMRSVADTLIIPLQDVMSLGSKARMNYPGRPSGNWGWRFTPEMLRAEYAQSLRDMVEVYGRAPQAQSKEASEPEERSDV
jgi:4-alpha-glucanotransferase